MYAVIFEVEPAAGEDIVAAPAEDGAAAPSQPAAPAVSIVLSAPVAKAAKPVATIAPLVAKSISKFTVTVEGNGNARVDTWNK